MNADHSPASTLTSLPASPSGTGRRRASYPASASAWQTGRAISGSPSACTTATIPASPSSEGSSPSTPVPITTSYGVSPPTAILLTRVP